jgi:hypothetical protein
MPDGGTVGHPGVRLRAPPPDRAAEPLLEEQTGALGLVLNALVLLNTRYMDAAVNRLRHHINMLCRSSFQLPDLPSGLRPLRDPGTPDEE